MKEPLPTDTQAMLDSLQKTVRETLERKRRLGQYAIVGENGQIKKLTPESHMVGEDKSEYNTSNDQQS